MKCVTELFSFSVCVFVNWLKYPVIIVLGFIGRLCWMPADVWLQDEGKISKVFYCGLSPTVLTVLFKHCLVFRVTKKHQRNQVNM